MPTYPAQIDNAQTLPLAVDNVTPVNAAVFNPLRNSVIALETALGINPGGIYTSVAARLNNLEGVVGNLQVIELAQDLGGTLSAPFVIGLQGRPLSNSVPIPGQFLGWNGIAWAPLTISGGGGGIFVAAGDLSGTSTNQTVVGINGARVTTAGAIGNALQVTSSNNLGYAPINLAGGSNFVTGLLPTANQVAQSLAGDVTGITSSNTVIALRGNTVKNQALGSSQDGYVLTWVNGASDWEARPTAGTASNMHTVHSVITGSSYNVSVADDAIPVDTTNNPVTINLPSTPTIGLTHIIFDVGLNVSLSHPITVAGNGHNILTNGGSQTSIVINTNAASVTIMFNGTTWSII